MRILRSTEFWIGVGVGAVVVPIALRKFAPSAASKLPSTG
jgi:hypothetical protein